MNPLLRETKRAIRTFMNHEYSDDNLVQILEHARSGQLSFYSCCCFIGIPTCDHRTEGFRGNCNALPFDTLDPHHPLNPGRGTSHLNAARRLPGAMAAERAFERLAKRSLRLQACGCKECIRDGEEATRRRLIIPMVLAEIRRRQRQRIPVNATQQELVTA